MQYNIYKNNPECDMASCHKVMQCTARTILWYTTIQDDIVQYDNM